MLTKITLIISIITVIKAFTLPNERITGVKETYINLAKTVILILVLLIIF